MADDRFSGDFITDLAELVATRNPPALLPDERDALSNFRRSEARSFFGEAGQLFHYGDDPGMKPLIELVEQLQRAELQEGTELRPGDRVRLTGELAQFTRYNREVFRSWVFTVRYVGDDGTVDIQPDINDDYVIETVLISAIRRLN